MPYLDEYSDFHNILTILSGLAILTSQNKNPKSKVYDLDKIYRLQRLCGVMNHQISLGKTHDDVENFLMSFGIEPHLDKKYYFPTRENKKRTQKRTETLDKICDTMCYDLQKCPKVISFDDFLLLEADAFNNSDNPINVLLHTRQSRRKPCCYMPIDCMIHLLLSNLKKGSLVQIKKHNSKVGNKLPVVELSIKCLTSEYCDSKCKFDVHIPREKFIALIKRVDQSQSSKISKSYELDDLPVDELYDRVLSSRVLVSENHSTFICPSGCPPTHFEVEHECTACITTYKQNTGASNYHEMFCSTCSQSACGICSKPLSEHQGDKQTCQPKLTKTREEIEEGLKQNPPIYFCPVCSMSLLWAEGCPHLTCPCSTHFCALCYEQLRRSVNRGYGDVYGHVCKQTFANFLGSRNDIRYYHAPDQDAVYEGNPCTSHTISSAVTIHRQHKAYAFTRKYAQHRVVRVQEIGMTLEQHLDMLARERQEAIERQIQFAREIEFAFQFHEDDPRDDD